MCAFLNRSVPAEADAYQRPRRNTRLNSRLKGFVALGEDLRSGAVPNDDSDDSVCTVFDSVRNAADRSRANRCRNRAQQRQVVDPYDCEHSVSGAQRLFLDGSGLYDLNPRIEPVSVEDISRAVKSFAEQNNPFEKIQGCGSCGALVFHDDPPGQVMSLAELNVLRFKKEVSEQLCACCKHHCV